FDVFDKDGIRIILAACSRFPDDEHPSFGLYGLNFNRRAPKLQEALDFQKKLLEKDVEASNQYLNNFAFAANSEEEYAIKKEIYDKFLSYQFGEEPLIVYAAPHAGNIRREADIIVPDPADEIDRWTAGTVAVCDLNEKRKPIKREVHSIHTSNDQFKSYPAIIDLGTYGLMDERQLELIRKISENVSTKHKERTDRYLKEYIERVYEATEKKLKEIYLVRGTLDPEKLVSKIDRFNVEGVSKRLKDYGIDLEDPSILNYMDAVNRVLKKDEPRIIPNHIFPGKKVGKDLGMPYLVEQGKLGLALQYECSRFYMEKDPELVSDMILDIAKEAAEAFRS
ncbi:MAG: hypothetical protein NT129_01165, partial [Candidatus Aenigmarchaeota archaeon]|nr:hypothetical protein [Candidatus Aenigmarchaeota archaeon]